LILEYPDGKRAGEPRRFVVRPLWPVVLAAASTAVVAAGGLFSFVAVNVNATRGATRASRLKWQHTSAEIENAIAHRSPATASADASCSAAEPFDQCQ
jgi:hypothetical protein